MVIKGKEELNVCICVRRRSFEDGMPVDGSKASRVNN
jgi:hypothetical protein